MDGKGHQKHKEEYGVLGSTMGGGPKGLGKVFK